ncbi:MULTISPECIES: hypothetical protein [Bacillaceae]|uniref:Uncharacterized protein n=1 Tax=Parageobacillus galactosidasius TaxID=883812 RepID=A0A226QRG8_9BACL|nr:MULTISPECIES: hypothetical protein [Bacillaceae]OQO98552.1 hypothetical protein B1689_16305 [Geobacillus sp. 44C]PDM38781.1 hypothetical protein CN643_17485 [Parageobacillus yumthangensis]RDV21677.1 hypothetical protein DXK91_12670 [Parageobacillus toebii]OXB94945.1 hypothetical protein B9L23_08860 [Parageobacillus galactosidasius]PUF85602.1 hypothetical protein DCC82_16785 [Geobacillus sp. LYN3]
MLKADEPARSKIERITLIVILAIKLMAWEITPFTKNAVIPFVTREAAFLLFYIVDSDGHLVWMPKPRLKARYYKGGEKQGRSIFFSTVFHTLFGSIFFQN